MDNFLREVSFALRDRVVLFTILCVALLSTYTVINGLTESADEQALIERVKGLVAEDREYNLAKQSNAGGAAYYTFHFTYDEPSALAFASRGIRDDLPWKHRIRMLALEGQVYETDTGNPELSRIGKLDFAFLAAFILPLLSILLLYDLRAVEIRNNRWAFLSVTSGNGYQLLRQRAALRSLLLFIAAVIPFTIIAVINSAGYWAITVAIFAVALNLFFWCFLSLIILSKVESGPTTAAILLGCWLTLGVVIPVGGKFLVEQKITIPDGGEILLTQREAVNGAWDLPKEAIMAPFLKRHPQWADTPKVTRPFEWKWYYAFQQMGDQSVENLSAQLRNGITQRDNAMGFVSFLSPPLLTTRLLSQVANTDITAFQHYDNCVRDFHSKLREFHYPMLFSDVTYSPERMKKLPTFTPCSSKY